MGLRGCGARTVRQARMGRDVGSEAGVPLGHGHRRDAWGTYLVRKRCVEDASGKGGMVSREWGRGRSRAAAAVGGRGQCSAPRRSGMQCEREVLCAGWIE